MKKLSRVKKTWFAVALTSVMLGVFGAAGVVLFSLKLSYIPLAISILVLANAAYGCPFYFLRFADARLSLKILLAIDGGAATLKEISDTVGIKEEFAARLIEKYVKKDALYGHNINGAEVLTK